MWWGLCSTDSKDAIQCSLSTRTIHYLIQYVLPCVINITWPTAWGCRCCSGVRLPRHTEVTRKLSQAKLWTPDKSLVKATRTWILLKVNGVWFGAKKPLNSLKRLGGSSLDLMAYFLWQGTRYIILTSGRKFAVNLRVDFFVSNVASDFFHCFSYDGDNQDKALRTSKQWFQYQYCGTCVYGYTTDTNEYLEGRVKHQLWH